MNQNTNLDDLADLAVKAAIEAGKAILEVYYNSDFGIDFKADNSPLTIADKRAHNMIARILGSTGIPLLSEEGRSIPYEERKNWELFWMVDPLDGTKEFIKKNDEFTVNIALIQGNTPIVGVVFVPVFRQIYLGDQRGSFTARVDFETESLTGITRLPLSSNDDKFIIVGSRSHMSAETEEYIRNIDTKGKPIEIRSKGSSLKICMVAEGLAMVYPRLAPTMEWDTAAGHAIVKFAGKEIYQFGGNEPLAYNKENLLNPWFVVE